MKYKTLAFGLLLNSFYYLQAMETTIIEKPIADETLQKLIRNVNDTSLNIVTIIKQHAENNCVKINHHTLSPLLGLDKQKINTLFFNNINDDQLRPLLLDMGADINAQRSDKTNCLWRTKNPEILKELIAKGATVDILNEHGKTYLYDLFYYLSEYNGDENIKAARVLLEDGKADPNIAFEDLYTILHKTIDCSHPAIRFSAVALLCKHKVNTNIKDKYGYTPLIRVIKLGDINVVQLLLHHKADPDTPDCYGDHPLHIAFPQENPYRSYEHEKFVPAIVIALIEHQANPNIPYKGTKTTPLHVAVLRKQREIVKALIKNGADINAVDERGNTAWKLAQSENIYKQLTQEVVDLLISKNDTLTFTMTDFANVDETAEKKNPKKETTSWFYKQLGY